MAGVRRRLAAQTLPTQNENENVLAGKAKISHGNRFGRAALGDIANKDKPFITGKKQVLSRTEASTELPKLLPEIRQPMDMGDIGEALSECFPVSGDVEDIDKEDHDKPQLCAEYAKEIMRFLGAMERHYSVSSSYMVHQKEVNEKMRAILFDWLIQVHLKFHLLQETLYITIAIIDRFLAVHQVSKKELQLVGVSAMLLASKYEEMFAPEIGDFVYITDHAFTKKQIRQMESLIFRKLDFSLGKPLCLHFLRRNSKAGGVGAEEHTMAKYLMELTLTDYKSIQFLPSEIAAASLCLAMKINHGHQWTSTLEHYSGYSENRLMPCMRRLAQLVGGSLESKQKAVYNKYASSKFMRISTMSSLNSSIMKNLAQET